MLKLNENAPIEEPTRRKSPLVWLAGIGAVVALMCGVLTGAFYATPYFAIWGMRNAALNKDAPKFCSYIDFPVLRENLKAELNAKMLFEMQKDDKLKNNPFAGLATAAAPTMINNMIDGFVTPAAIERGFNQEAPSSKDKNVASQTLNKDFLSEEKGKVETSYKSLTEFQIAFIPNEGEPVLFIFERRSLIYWQLAGMKFK